MAEDQGGDQVPEPAERARACAVPPRARLFQPGERGASVVADALRTETVGGVILLVAALAAIVWANLPVRDSYESLRGFVPVDGNLDLGFLTFHLDLTVSKWAGDGLLAIFFFVVGLELKREFVAGALRNPAQAALPITAAVAGVVVPALCYVAVAVRAGPEAVQGWAIPAATDIAFALAVLAVIGSHLPKALRAFLLTLAVVDDLLAICIIAVFFTNELNAWYLLGALVPLAAFALLVQRHLATWYLLIPLALFTWLLVHESGVHATIAGVLLGFTVPVLRPAAEGTCLASHLEHVWRPISASVAIPVFAFLAAGVNFTERGVSEVFTDPVAQGVIAGLVLGKVVGIGGATYLVARFTGAQLDENLNWQDILGVACLGGIGFTVSLLVGDLSFAEGSEADRYVVTGVLLGSLISAGLAYLVLGPRNRAYKRLCQ